MPLRRVLIPDIGEVTLAKRRGAKNLRLSINAKGEVRVSMPSWTPYAAGISFAKSRQDWITKHLESRQTTLLTDGMAIGKAHRLRFVTGTSPKIITRLTPEAVIVTTGLPFSNAVVQAKAASAAERALRVEAMNLLPQRLQTLAATYGFEYKDVRVRKLTSRWGSCSHDKSITLSYFLIQMPWDLIDYVLLHELVHTKHLNHGPGFWRTFEAVLPSAKQRRKAIRQHSPRLESAQSTSFMA
jgi:predicted metal-dependent hydrolase